MSFNSRSIGKLFIWCGLTLTMSMGPVLVTQAQVLEEIVVTAQRREQNLQDVPVSLQTFGGDDLTRQGFDSLESLTTFAPGLVIKDWSEEQGLIMRGSGTQSKNLGIEQGVPTFLDGIHMGRGSQVKNAYMDIERIEVLKGPQPVFFGQNAAAGALNITTRKPGEEWEGSASAEFGSFGKQIAEGAFGGPITDTFGIRVAAKYHHLDGFLRDWWTGEKFPMRETKTFRVTTQWTPTDNFEATLKFEYSDNNLGPRAQPVVFEKFQADGTFKQSHAMRAPITGIASLNVPGVNQKVGEFTNLGIKYGPAFVRPGIESDAGVLQGLAPLTEASGSASGILLDFSQCQADGGLTVFPIPGATRGIDPVRPQDFDSCQFTDNSGSKPWHIVKDLTYTFNSGIELTSKTGYSWQEFWNTPYNSGGGIIPANNRERGEFFGQWSEEIRLSSAVGGEIEWMGGLYWQKNNLDAWSDAFRANTRNPLRATRTKDDSTWKSIFATVTFNFLDNRASVDIGGRYTDIHKEGSGQNRAGEYFVINEIDRGGDGSIVQLPYGIDLTGTSGDEAAFMAAFPGVRYGRVVGRTPLTNNCDALLGRTPKTAADVAAEAGNIGSQRCALTESSIDDSSFDPQIVLRYRPSNTVSLYAKYATSFKSGAFDMAVSEVPERVEDFTFGPENYTIYEAGLRGTFMEGRLAAEATIYSTDITGTQVSFIDRSEGIDRNVTSNVGAQKSDGIELSAKFAATERLTISGYLALLDGVILDFQNSVCTDDDRAQDQCLDANGNPSNSGYADRSGRESRNAPNWQYTGNLRYELPVMLDGYWSNFDTTIMGTSAYTTDRSFSDVYSYDTSWDVNLSFEFGGDDDRWSVLLYGRNLAEVKPVYHSELDFTGEGIAESSAQVTTSNYASYGARFKFNFF